MTAKATGLQCSVGAAPAALPAKMTPLELLPAFLDGLLLDELAPSSRRPSYNRKTPS